MKTLKLVLIAAVVSFAMMSYADNSTQQVEKERIIRITLEQALTHHGLVCAMYQQLTPASLKLAKTGLYVATVKYSYRVFEIRGTKEAWAKFFRIKPGWEPITCQD